jgi:hypothetical protein
VPIVIQRNDEDRLNYGPGIILRHYNDTARGDSDKLRVRNTQGPPVGQANGKWLEWLPPQGFA